jgi:hypothetical protein
LFVSDPTYAKLNSMHFWSWKKGLKTGCYYLRTKAPVMAQKFTVDPRLLAAVSGTGSGEHEVEDDDDSVASDDSEESYPEPGLQGQLVHQAPAPAPGPQGQAEDRRALMERLAKEYEEAVAQAKEEGCLSCGS